MVLHAPEDAGAVGQLDGLQPHVVARQHHRARGKLLDIIAVHRDRLEHRRLAREHAVATPRIGELDAARESELPPQRIAAHPTAGRAHRHLQAPAAAEERHAGGKRRPRQLDLPLNVCAAVVDVQRRAGDRHTVVARKSGTGREPHLAVRRPHDVAAHGPQALQHLRVAFAGGLTAGGDLLRACRRPVPVNHQDARLAHVSAGARAAEPARRRARGARAARPAGR